MAQGAGPADRDASSPPVRNRGNDGIARESAAWDRAIQNFDPLVLWALAVLGAGLGVGLLLFQADDTSLSRSFVQSPGFLLWAAVIAAQTACWAVLAVPVWIDVLATYRAHGCPKRVWAVPVIIAAALAALLWVSPSRQADWPLVGHQEKAVILTAAAALGVALPAVTGLAILHEALRAHRVTKPTVDDVGFILGVASHMGRFLALAGTVITLAVLASGSLRYAVIDRYVPQSEFPATNVLVYGGFFTALLAVAYLPVQLRLRQASLDVLNGYFPQTEVPEPTSDEFATWIGRRESLSKVLQLDHSPVGRLRSSVFILSPLASAILGTAVTAG